MSIIIKYHHTPVGELIIGSHLNQLCLCDWRYRTMRAKIDKRIQTALGCTYATGDSAVIHNTVLQLEQYFARQRKQFELPLHFVGTDFQQKVWHQLIKIPYGHTCSYLDLSRTLGKEKAIRAVAAANGANALSIIVPCHRVIGSKGKMVGYAGGLFAKRKLLLLENSLNIPTQLSFC
ncbi:methylated-DNA--[protein]-cysteine S-methyltransferase [Saccharicrinis carchari]|uniref:methylated-DNA--[protein]-cysteine S-methyltransferase n=1 Tax=Saccharicrinis carchari TaxID=1168039 RepID=UPI001C8F289D|nr:methylated-DNA--[protein]-cysteine S-methyltransferase [Saccharicrinis carchari]